MDAGSTEIKALLQHVMQTFFRAKDSSLKNEAIMQKCIQYFSKDYKFSVIHNTNGELSANYPNKIIVLEYELSGDECRNAQNRVESLYDVNELQELFNQCKNARSRSRFVVPVILYEGRHICRSSTIAGGLEIYSKAGYETVSGASANIWRPGDQESHIFDKLRGLDIKVLKTFAVTHICDLMVESKKVKYGVNVTSSEYADKENRYSEFSILSLPYPGCEFFKEWKSTGYRAAALHYDWSQSFVNRQFSLPNNTYIKPPQHINWNSYQAWDLLTLTKNYFMLVLHYIKNLDTGVLIHCISGWDRTPLFVALVRLSLWADGLVHKSLTPAEILYLVIAYDWFLFGHDFPDRTEKGEEVFFFCFNFLKHITGDEFSICKRRCRSGNSSGTDSDHHVGVLLENSGRFTDSHKGSSSSLNSVSSSHTSSSCRSSSAHDSHNTTQDDLLANANGLLVNSYHLRTPMGGASSPESCSVSPHDATASISMTSTITPGSGNKSNDTGDPGAAQFVPNAPNCTATMAVSPDMQCSMTPTMSSIMTSATTPVSVPLSVSRAPHVGGSSGAASLSPSWHVVIGAGSVKGVAGSLHESTGDARLHEHGNTATSDLPEDSPRKQRLDAVRILFMNIYTSLPVRERHNEASLTGLLNNLAKNIGIKA